jgi:hypothetical protein
MVSSSDGEYEYFKTIAAVDLPALLDLPGGHSGVRGVLVRLAAREMLGQRL